MAVAPHALAAQSALAVLREGGNAVEAMIAAAATIAVVYPHMNSIGGDSFWLVHVPGREPQGIDACGAAAQAASIDWYARARHHRAIPFRGGVAANTVAGTISGWGAGVRAQPRSSAASCRSRACSPTRSTTRKTGIPVTRSQHANTPRSGRARAAAGLRRDVPPRRRRARPAGRIFVQPKLAATLERLARAGTRRLLPRRPRARDRADLAAGRLARRARRPRGRTPRSAERRSCSSIRSAALYNMPPPTQGVVSLAILGHARPRSGSRGLDPVGADLRASRVEATKRAFRDPRPAHHRSRVHEGRRAVAARRRRSSTSSRRAIARDTRGAVGPGQAARRTRSGWASSTATGRAVSFIQSVYHEFGSGVVLDATGISWQNRGCSFSLDERALNALEPGRKPFHTLNPALALLKDGRTMVYGNMGGDGQPQTQSAVFTPHAGARHEPAGGDRARRAGCSAAPGARRATRSSSSRASRRRSWPSCGAAATTWRSSSPTTRSWVTPGAIVRHPDGTFEGGADPRSDGSVAAY